MDLRSIITLPVVNERPVLPRFERSANDTFLRRLNASGKKWVIIVDTSDRPSFVLDAHHFLRDALFNTTSVDPEIYWHRPIVVTDLRAPLGSVIGRMRVKPEHPEDDVIDDDLILVWGDQKRIITGKSDAFRTTFARNRDSRRRSTSNHPQENRRRANNDYRRGRNGDSVTTSEEHSKRAERQEVGEAPTVFAGVMQST